MRVKLTSKLVESLKPREKPYNVVDSELRGFLVRVEPSGVKSYFARYCVNGRQTQMKIADAAVKTPAEARDKAKKIMGEAVDGKDPVTEKRARRIHMLGAYLDKEYGPKYLAHKKSGGASYKRIKSCFKDFLMRKLDDPTLHNALVNWRSRRLSDGKDPATVNRDLGTLRTAFSWALDQGLIKANPMAKIKPLKLDKSPKVRYLDEQEERRLLDALDTREERNRAGRDSFNLWRRERGLEPLPDLRACAFADYLKPMVLISLCTGMRRGEVFNLEWADVDFARSTVTVRGAVAKTGTTRHIPLNDLAMGTLQGWRAQTDGAGLVFPAHSRKATKTPPADDTPSWVDATRKKTKTPGAFDNVNTAWRMLLDKEHANISAFRWHDMRHHFASKLVMAGVDLNTVRDLLGHTDLKMTVRYAHLAPQAKAAAVQKIVFAQSNVVAFPATKPGSRE
ncbi:MAG: tyrosine-type recombinase/integrase [Candidatus Hydrogenedentes bacterium]|nr:tyrosine-type recombinase/integrase [Candidatus Hydrogenedentota bacterium]